MIKVQALSKTFGDPKSDKAVRAVKDMSFEVQPGEMFAFLGPNGAGKTTTIKMLTTLLQPDERHDRDRRAGPGRRTERGAQALRHRVPGPEPRLASSPRTRTWTCTACSTTCRARCARERIETLLKLFELWDRRKALAKTFSGGMRRRLEIARGFLHTPKILFLDEPTLGLDPQSRNQLWTHVKH